MKWLDTLQHRWTVGFGVLLLMLASLVAWGLGAALVLAGLSLLVPFSVDEWLPLSALIWGPLAVGSIMPTIARNFHDLKTNDDPSRVKERLRQPVKPKRPASAPQSEPGQG